MKKTGGDNTMKLHEQYYVEKAKVEKLIAKKNQKDVYKRQSYGCADFSDTVITTR